MIEIKKVMKTNKTNIEIDSNLIVNSINNYINKSDESLIPKKHLLKKLDLILKLKKEKIDRIDDTLNIVKEKINSFDNKINELDKSNNEMITMLKKRII
jgi:hypothetical protein